MPELEAHVNLNPTIEDATDGLPPPPPAPGAGTGAGTGAVLPDNVLGGAEARTLIECVQQLRSGMSRQAELLQMQSDLLQKLHSTVLTSRSMISELVVANGELKEEIQKIGKVARRDGFKTKKKEAPFAPKAKAMLSVAGQTPDEEIEAIIESRRKRHAWPVKHSTLNCFSVQQDLVKIRFHHSEKYQHVPIRIPKTEKNKDGTRPCKLCSEGKIRRKTTWMCATCEVPLCTRPLMEEDGSSLTHHAKWHSVRDLIAEHRRCHDDLKKGRESRKRAREEVGEATGLVDAAGVGAGEEEDSGATKTLQRCQL